MHSWESSTALVNLHEYFGHWGSKQLHSEKPLWLGYKIWCGTTSRRLLGVFEVSQGTLFTKPDRGLDMRLYGSEICGCSSGVWLSAIPYIL